MNVIKLGKIKIYNYVYGRFINCSIAQWQLALKSFIITLDRIIRNKVSEHWHWWTFDVMGWRGEPGGPTAPLLLARRSTKFYSNTTLMPNYSSYTIIFVLCIKLQRDPKIRKSVRYSKWKLVVRFPWNTVRKYRINLFLILYSAPWPYALDARIITYLRVYYKFYIILYYK